MKKQAIDKGKKFAKHVSDNLHPKYTQKNPLKFINKKQLKYAQKILTDTPPKKIYKWLLRSIENVLNIILSLGNCKLKRWGATKQQLEWLKKVVNAKCWQGCRATGTHSLYMGMQSGTATLAGRVAVSYKAKHSLTILSRKHIHLPIGV